MPASGPVLDRGREVELLVAALDGGAHVLLEGPLMSALRNGGLLNLDSVPADW